jgi:hypothetical protein
MMNRIKIITTHIDTLEGYMSHTEVSISGTGTASMISLFGNEENKGTLTSREDDIIGEITLREITGKRMIFLPLEVSQVNDLLDVMKRGPTEKYTVKKILNQILGQQVSRYNHKKIIVHKILLSEKNAKLQAEVFIKEEGAFEIDSFPCELLQAFLLYVLQRTKLFVDETLFGLWVNFDLTIGKAAGDSPEDTIQETLRDRLRRMDPEDFGKYSL